MEHPAREVNQQLQAALEAKALLQGAGGEEGESGIQTVKATGAHRAVLLVL